ncbi:WxL domain-containing protein [Enterococcus faecium]|uniref:WxL domain-containing protein n=1 Tax=Enterococcus faecium TaxID=1352 RepID=UPI002DBCBF28|nr:WxL domain-containing protein [Enterococcus faecium]MEB7868937.1 WxL domain-containing protein [Enterococcus faecium]
MKKHVTLFSSVLMMSTTLLGAGGVFATEASPKTANTPVTAELTINETPSKPVAPVEPGEGGGDNTTDITGLYGIAYTPSALSGRAELIEKGQQEIQLTNSKSTENKFNVGVQDKTRKNDQQWVLKAKLTWEDDTNNYMSGTSITATGGNVKENKDGTLEELTSGQVTTQAENLSIGQISESEIMKATNGQTMNGVYNYQFQSPKLVIPNTERVAAGNYSGNINWNLENTPTI